MSTISIIVPVYKVEQYLDRCINSIVSQTYQDLEIILVDDGSPDNCPEMCEQWAKNDPRIRVIHRENGGLSAARNSGLDAMTGEYVMFVDSDDMIHPKTCEMLFKAIKENFAQVSFCNFQAFGDEIRDFGYIDINVVKFKKFSKTDSTIDTFYTKYAHQAWAKLYVSEIFKTFRFKEGIIYEDLQIKPYIVLSDQLESYVHCEIPMYFYYVSSQSICRSNITPKKFEAVNIAFEHYNLFKPFKNPTLQLVLSYNIFKKFIKLAVIEKDKTTKRLHKKYYFKYLFPILLIPNKYLSIKNKLIFLSTIIPSKKLRAFYLKQYEAEGIFEDMNNL